MTDANERAELITREESRGSAALWFGVLGAPIAWVLHMTIGYSLEEWFACSPSTNSPGEIIGVDARVWALAITFVFASIAVAAGLVALGSWRRSKDDATEGNRARWMAVVGIMNSALYLVIILGGMGPAFLLQVCESSP